MSRRVAVVLLAVVALAAGLVLAVESASAAGSNRAGLVVAFPDGAETVWVEFEEPEISGAELLERAGFDVAFSSFGGLGGGVCAIDGVGCSNPGDCFCQCKSGSCSYWAYFRLEGRDWVYQTVGASSRMLGDGDVDGWAWGSGAAPPGMVSAVPCPTPNPPPPASAPAPTTVPPPSAVSDGGSAAEPSAAPSGAATSSAPLGDAAPTPVSAPPDDSVPPTPTPAPTSDARQALRAIERPGPPSVDSEEAIAARSEPAASDGGSPAGLIAFGAVAGAMVLGVGAVAVRRRLRG